MTTGIPMAAGFFIYAPQALVGLPVPDAVFVGGGATEPGLLDECRERLAPGGRLVAHAVTLQTEQLLIAAFHEHGGELTRINVEQVTPLGRRFSGWTPARAVTQWAWRKEARCTSRGPEDTIAERDTPGARR